MAPASFFPTPPLSYPTIHNHTTTDVLCTICIGILDQPIELTCGNLICLFCCTKWLTSNDREDCPCCYSCLQDHAHPPSRLTMAVLEANWWNVLEDATGLSSSSSTGHTFSPSVKHSLNIPSTPLHALLFKTSWRRKLVQLSLQKKKLHSTLSRGL